jgi:hypothetical protein
MVNSNFGPEAREKGDTVDLRLPTKQVAYPIVPGIVPTEPDYAKDITPEKVPIKLDRWEGSSFHLSDQDIGNIDAQAHFIPVQSIEAVDALAEVVNADILSNSNKIFGFVGTPGTTPFEHVGAAAPTADHEDTRAIVRARATLNNQKADPRNRRFVMDPDAEGNALGLRAFQDVAQAGDAGAKREGQIGFKFGFDVSYELQMPTHEAGSFTAPDPVAKSATVQAVGLKDVVLTTGAATGAADLFFGDIITFGNSTQTHVVTQAVAEATAATDFTVKIEPGLKVALAGGETVTLKATHVINLGFHRDAFAFVNRPLLDDLGLNAQGNEGIVAVTDPVSGLTMRLERKREHKRWVWEYDMLWGTELVIRELAVRVAG